MLRLEEELEKVKKERKASEKTYKNYSYVLHIGF